MTIVFFCRLFYPHVGGVEKHVQEVGKRLVKKSHRVIVITEKLDQTHSNNKQSPLLRAKQVGKVDGIEIYRINPGKDNWLKKFRIWKQLWELKKLMVDADVIHCHDVFFWYLPFRFIYPTKKIFTTFHGYEGNKIPSRKAIFMHKLAEKLSKGNICVGDFLKKWYGTKPTFVIYGAVDKKLITQDSKPTNQNKDAMFLGRLENETGIIEYLKATKLLKDEGIVLSLDIFGDGKLRNEAEKYAAINKLKINFKGFISNATDFIKDYKFIFVSRYLGILEAMAVKKPIFAQYNNEIKKDYLQTAPFSSFISISKSGEEIASSVQNYIKGETKVDTTEAYNWVKDKTWDNIVNVYLKLWS